ncbi:MAG TPA: hypothetical protein VM390_00550 [Acidimicrobiales bacterium]|jgi:hypothetical protein|nr:hypothetical protein [Acidimicrobiales bacterium]
MGPGSGIYKFILVLHLLAVIAGFGPTILAPAFGAQAKARKGREGLAISEATFSVLSKYAEWIIYSVPIFGILLIMVSDGAIRFSDLWITLSFTLYIVALGLVHAVHYKNLKRMNVLMAELAAGPPPGAGGGGPPPQVAELEQRGKQVALVGTVLNLILVAIVFLMVWQPR